VIINNGNKKVDISKNDCIPNLISVASLIKLDNKPEVGDMVIETWNLCHSLRTHIIQNNETVARDRLIKMVKYLLPLISDVVPQVGRLDTSNPSEYNRAYLALNKLLDEHNENGENQ